MCVSTALTPIEFGSPVLNPVTTSFIFSVANNLVCARSAPLSCSAVPPPPLDLDPRARILACSPVPPPRSLPSMSMLLLSYLQVIVGYADGYVFAFPPVTSCIGPSVPVWYTPLSGPVVGSMALSSNEATLFVQYASHPPPLCVVFSVAQLLCFPDVWSPCVCEVCGDCVCVSMSCVCVCVFMSFRTSAGDVYALNTPSGRPLDHFPLETTYTRFEGARIFASLTMDYLAFTVRVFVCVCLHTSGVSVLFVSAPEAFISALVREFPPTTLLASRVSIWLWGCLFVFA